MSSPSLPHALLGLALALAGTLAQAADEPAAAVPPGTVGTGLPAVLPARLGEALAMALGRRPDVRAAEQSVAGARQRALQAMARFYPSLDLSVAMRNTLSYDSFSGVRASGVVQGQTITIDVSKATPRYTYNPALRLSYDAYTGGHDTAARLNAEALEQSARLSGDTIAREAVREVVVTYLQRAKAGRALRLARARLDFAQSHEQVTQARLAGGKASELDLQADRQASAQRRLDLVVAQQQWQARTIDYVAALGLAPEDVPPTDAAAVESDPAVLEAELAALDQRGVPGAAPGITLPDDAAELRRAAADLEAARQSVVAEKAGWAPQVNVYAQYSGVGRSETDLANALNKGRRAGVEVGVTVSMNLFGGGATDARVAEAQAQAGRLHIELDRLRLQLKQVRAKLTTELEQAGARQAFAEQRHELAQTRLRVAEARARVGRDEIDAVEAARMDLTEVEHDIDSARIDTAIARARLQFATSRIGD